LGEKKEKIETFQPAYLKLYQEGKLRERVDLLYKKLERCTICPRGCEVNRLEDEKGYCRTGKQAIVSSLGPHFGEESCLVGSSGSGTIFFTHCNLGCKFCQNYDISHLGYGDWVEEEDLAEMMLRLQRIGCHNINFVTPTHAVPQILRALLLAIEKGLNLPLVYNSGGYDSVSTLKVLDGIFDIYMPDFKYYDPGVSEKYSNAPDYPEIAKKALKEMHRQVGDLVLDNKGIALRGLLIRHLVLPDNLSGTKEAMRFISKEISPNSYVNVMEQYRPAFKALDFPRLNRGITQKEYLEAIKIAKDAGLTRLDG
jgi:putative pyruvate formate lyase activating enzyme